jgi:glycosyltransferase involved in cell wall biosynthesis
LEPPRGGRAIRERDFSIMANAIFIAWEPHRRTSELCRVMGLRLFVIDVAASRVWRYTYSIAATTGVLLRERPRLLFVQNPSMVLTAYVCLLKWLGFKIVVDRHSNFNDFRNMESGFFNAVSDFTLRHADLTIVTNDYLKELVDRRKGRGFVLPDRLPEIQPPADAGPPLGGRGNVVFVSTYASDEPLSEVIDAARLLPPDVHVHVTGNDKRLDPRVRASAPPNVVFTGFLPEDAYIALLARADCILELTKNDHTLLCGAYEAVSLGRPLVLSRKEALTRYFCKGAVVTDNEPAAIAAAVTQALATRASLERDIRTLRDELTTDWSDRFARLTAEIASLSAGAADRMAVASVGADGPLGERREKS